MLKGLLRKDLLMTVKYCRAFFLIVVLFLGISLLGEENIFFAIYPTMIAGIIPMTLISYDERDRWNAYSAVLPYSRAQIVSAKYIVGLLFGAVAYVASMATAAVAMQIHGTFSMEQLAILGGILVVLGAIGPALLLPFAFKYGAEKGRIAFYVLIGAFAALSALLASSSSETAISLKSPWILAALAAAAIALYLLSWRMSIAFYQRREL